MDLTTILYRFMDAMKVERVSNNLEGRIRTQSDLDKLEKSEMNMKIFNEDMWKGPYLRMKT